MTATKFERMYSRIQDAMAEEGFPPSGAVAKTVLRTLSLTMVREHRLSEEKQARNLENHQTPDAYEWLTAGGSNAVEDIVLHIAEKSSVGIPFTGIATDYAIEALHDGSLLEPTDIETAMRRSIAEVLGRDE